MSEPAHLPPAVPVALRERVRAALGAAGDGAGAPSPAACLDAGEALLARVLASDERSRGTALDLLAADALVTWAFELAADSGGDLEALAGEAMRRIGRHAMPAGAP